MAKKTFFKERSENDILCLDTAITYRQKGLTKKIDSLEEEEGLVIRTVIVPGKFFRNAKNGSEASRKCFKHGDLILLSQPRSLEEALNSSEIPLEIRERDFSALSGLAEEDINFIGYSFKPVQGSDRTRRAVPFYSIPEAAKLYAYAEQMTEGIDVMVYSSSKRALKEGASVIVEVPSRSLKSPRYTFKLLNVPIQRGRENLASVLSLDSSITAEDIFEEPVRGCINSLYANLRYNFSNINEGSRIKIFNVHEITAYYGVIDSEFDRENEKFNLTPLEMSPFVLPSKHQMRFYDRLCNNVLIYDHSLSSKSKLRKLHLAEKSILLGRATILFGNQDFAFCDASRDGLLREY